ncbi:MAG: uroporphyrinogen-III C-methyltransferase [Planctomycetaceae bacterium]|nr:uroporphyrinogen-III C-methyltransferase [Planctomycetaceae bacterium]
MAFSAPEPRREPAATPARGRVDLVGAGPGDPGLITLRGVELLGRADVVLYDYLVNPRLLEHCRADATLVCLGKHGRDRILTQDEINARMTAEGLSGKRVVRLKGGDPAVFARFAEEVEAIEAAGLDYEVVPGITTALAVGSHAGIALTDRRHASAVALVTGHERDEQLGTKLDYAALADFPGTLVFYMGVTNAPEWTAALIEAGKPADTPAAVVRRCSWPDQQTYLTTLGQVPQLLQTTKLRPPVLTIVGDTVAARGAATWFSDRPLFGRRIVLGRPEHQCTAARNRLEELGAAVFLQPAIRIGPPDDGARLEALIERAGEFDWIAFSSVNGVASFCDRLRKLGRDGRALKSAKLAAIGPGTAEALAQRGLLADLVPSEYRAEALAAALAQEAKAGRKRFLLIRASRGREVLAETLTAAGAEVEQVVAYRSDDVSEPAAEVAALVKAGKIDWITVTSSAIARSLVKLFGDDLRRAKLASISPITTATLAELGYQAAAEATVFTLDGLVEAILAAERRGE